MLNFSLPPLIRFFYVGNGGKITAGVEGRLDTL